MKRHILALLSLAPFALLSIGCGSNGDDQSGGSGGGTSSGDFCDAYGEARASFDTRCATDDPAGESGRAKSYADACRKVRDAAGAGDISTEYSACAATLNASDCFASPDDDGCTFTVTGSLAEGGVCFDDAQCATGNCALADDGNCGVCAAPIADGAQCPFGSGCGAGNYCNITTFECHPLASRRDAGGACARDSDCLPPNHCHLDSASSGTCTAPLGEGAACASMIQDFGDCAHGLQCISGACATPGGLGDACATPGDAWECISPARCDASTLTCVAPTFAAPSAPCDDVTVFCSIGDCGFDDHACPPPAMPDGGACVTSLDCGGDSYCDYGGSEGVCAPNPTSCE